MYDRYFCVLYEVEVMKVDSMVWLSAVYSTYYVERVYLYMKLKNSVKNSLTGGLINLNA